MFSEKNIKEPIRRLATQVLEGNLPLERAMEQIAARETLAQFEDITIAQLDDNIRALAEQNLTRAIVLAVLNCQIARCKGSDIVWGHCNFTLGWLYLQRNELELALHHYQEASKTFEPLLHRTQKSIAQIRHSVGEIRERQGNLAVALDEYQQALTLAQGLKFPELESDVRNGLGRLYLAQGQVDAALEAFQQALELSQNSGDKRGEETSQGNLGRAYYFLGRLNEAEDCYRQATILSRKIGHQAGTGRHLNNWGNLLIERSKLNKAEDHLREALEIARRRRDRYGEQQRLGGLGNLYQARAKRETRPQQRETWLIQAEQHHQKAVEIACERKDQRGQGTHALNLGNVYSELGRFEAATECYTQALHLAEASARDTADIHWRVQCAWGNLCAAQSQDRLAFDRYVAAIEIVEEQRSELKIESRIKFWQERAILYKRMVLCCLRLGQLWTALVYTERAKTRYLADLLTEGSAEKHVTRSPLQRASEPTDNTLKTIEAVIKDLPASTVVVIFNLTEMGTIIFLVTDQPGGKKVPSGNGWQISPDGRVRARLIEDFSRDDLQNLLLKVDDSGRAVGGYLHDYYANNPQWRESTLESVNTEIYTALLAPVHHELTRLSVERVVFMPNLGLSLVPLHACYEVHGTERNYLLDQYEITYAPSFDVLRHCRERARRIKSGPGARKNLVCRLFDSRLDFLAVANPTSDLIWADVEVERIVNLFQKSRVQVLGSGKKDRATQKAVIAAAHNSTFVHFACHGKFNLREPLSSTLSLAPDPGDPAPDGPQPKLLTLKTILTGDTLGNDQAAVTLGPLKLPRTRLVVMSACETGLMDPGDLADEYVNLSAGFLLAGAPTVLSSLWAVDDLSTALLIERFYLYHLQGDPEPLAPAQALRRAQQWLRDEVTAAMVAEICRQRTQALQAQPGSGSAQSAFIHYDLLPPASRPFANPVFWAPFVILG